MSFRRYREYEDSGVSWLGEMPSHWSARRYKQVFVEREERSEAGEETLLSVSAYTGVTPRSDLIEAGDHLSRAESLEGYKICHPNDLVMNIMLAWNRGLGFSRLHGIVSPAYSVYEPLPGNHPRFLDYMVRSDRVTHYYKAFSAGVIDSRLRLYPDTFGALYCALPPFDEQVAIAIFLDHEIVKIDALVDEQKRLIELLKEKRQAVISQAVTKGLDPNVPMKDSGVEWLGVVPAHWRVMRLKVVAESIKAGPFGSALTKDQYVRSGYRVYGQEQVIPADFSIGDYYITAEKFEELRQYATCPGDILISCVGTFGKIALVPEDIEAGIINPRLLRLRVGPLASPGFLCTVLRSSVTFEQFALTSRGGTMDVINIGTLADIQIALPPLDEQRRIVANVKDTSSDFDTLAEAAETAISLLQERRTALISAAVTGKIDVRGLVQQPDAVAA